MDKSKEYVKISDKLIDLLNVLQMSGHFCKI